VISSDTAAISIYQEEVHTKARKAQRIGKNSSVFSAPSRLCVKFFWFPIKQRLKFSIISLEKDFIVISGNKPPLPEYFPDETVVFYSPWVNELENGSYLYKNNWETIDHILVSGHFFDNSGLEYEKTTVLNYDPFTDPDGNPVSYNARTGYGLSDHLPLLVTLFFDSGGLGVKRVEDGL